MARLKEYYQKTVIPEMMKKFKYQNIMEVPRLEKIVLNMGVGEAIQNIKILDGAVQELAGDHEGQEVDRHLQAPQGHADRLHRDAPEGADV